MTLDQIFSSENIKDYSRACVDIALDLPQKDFDCLLLPSRGAFPFFVGVVHALSRLARDHTDYARFNKTLELPRTVKSYVSEKEFGGPNSERKVLLIPFTADLNVSGIIDGVDESSLIDLTRDYWAHVTTSFLRDPTERKKDLRFNFFTEIILRNVEGRERDAVAYEQFPKVSKLVMLDTVISGRASSTIIGALEKISKEHGLPSLPRFSYLIIDENGKKLKNPFKLFLDTKTYESKVQQIKIPRIVSEDEGASLEGIAAIVYPTIMKKSFGLNYRGKPLFIGAGNWVSIQGSEPYFSVFNQFSEIVKEGIDQVLINEGYIDPSRENTGSNFETSRENFVNRLNRTKELSLKDDAGDFVTSKMPAQKVYETGSRVLHVLFSEGDTNDLLQGFADKHKGVIFDPSE